MFDAVRNNKRIVQVFLAAIILPFAFWGVESYISNAGAGNDVAAVGGAKITMPDFIRALQSQQERLRSSGREIPPGALNSPEMRAAVVEGLVNQKLLAEFVIKSRLGIGDRQLAEIITSISSLQENGVFSKERYESLVAAQGTSTAAFEFRLRQDIMNRQVSMAVDQASLPGATASVQWAGIQLEEREVVEAVFKPDAYLAKVKLEADAAKKYYDANIKLFEMPEQLRPEYVVLSRQVLAAGAEVGEDEIKSWYSSHGEQYKQPEQRRASHILIPVAKDAAETAVKEAKAKIEDIRERLKKDPGSFAALAKQYSKDPVSSAKGGDLDWFGRGMMVKAFEDTAFALKEGETSDVVRSDFGFHLIRLTGLREEKVKSLEEVRGEVVTAMREQIGQRKFAELSEGFSNMVYEQSDSLKPVAEKFHLQIQGGEWMVKGHPGKAPLASPKIVAALFSDDAVKNQRNTEAVEVSPGTLLAARVAEHKAAVLKPFDEVRAEVERRLSLEQAGVLATKAGEDALATLRKGENAVGVEWGSAKTLARLGAQNVSPKAAKAIFSAETSKLPAYTGVTLPDGSYAVFRIQQVKPYIAKQGDEKLGYLKQQYAELIANEELAALLTSLRKSISVDINHAALEQAERQ